MPYKSEVKMKKILISLGIIMILVGLSFAQEINVGGFMKTLYTVNLREGVSDNFTTPWADIWATGKIGERISYRFEQKFAPTPTQLYFAYFNFELFPYATLRAGQFAMPFGLNWYTYPMDILTPDYSAATAMLWAPGEEAVGVNKGVQIAGGVKDGIKINYYAALFSGDPTIEDYTAVGMIDLSPIEGITVGVSRHQGKYAALTPWYGTKEDRIFNDGYIKFNMAGFDLQGEYIGGEVGDKKKVGWHALTAYKMQLPVEHPWPEISIQPVARYTSFDPNTDTEDDEETHVDIGINLYYGENLKCQLFYEMNGETPEVDNDRILLQLQLMYGPGKGIF